MSLAPPHGPGGGRLVRLWLPALVCAQMLGILYVDRIGSLWPLAPALAVGGVLLASRIAFARRGIALAALVGSAFLIGGVALDTRAVDPDRLPALVVGDRVTLDARVARVARTPDGLRVELGELRRVEGAFGTERPSVPTIEASGKLGGGADPARWPGRLRLYVDASEFAFARLKGVRVDDRLRLHVAIRPVDGPRNPGGSRADAASRRRGVWGRATLTHEYGLVSMDSTSPPRHGRFVGLRVRAVDRLTARGEGGRLLAALGLGASDALSSHVRDSLARLGLSHLVAISGLHLCLIAALAFAIAGGVARIARVGGWLDPTPWKAAFAVAAAAGYAAQSGFGVPARRALVLLVVALALHAAGRRSAWPAAWCLAAAGVLAFDPASLFELGAQLSFGVTAALAFARLDDTALSDAPTRVTSMLRSVLRLAEVSAVAMAASAWILAWHGRATSIWALSANAIAVPITGVALLPCALLSGALAVLVEASPFGHDVSPCIDPILDGLAAATGGLLSSVEAAALRVELPGPPIVSTFVLVPALCAALASARVTTPSLRCVAALACVAWIGWAGAIRVADDDSSPAELVAFDVGQGDATLLRGGGAAILIDAGWASPSSQGARWDAGARVIVPALRALGVERLDLLVLTHSDLDHRGGARAILESMEVARVWVPSPSVDAGGFAALRAMALARGIAWEGRTRDDPPHRFGAFDVETLWPPSGFEPANPNQSSLVLAVTTGTTRLLLMADAGIDVERRLLAHPARLRADVLKLGHHGSRSATGEAFLHAVAPQIAIVSAGCGADRALPHPSTLEKLEWSGVPHVGWTGRDGALRFELAPAPRARPFEPTPSRRVCRRGVSP